MFMSDGYDGGGGGHGNTYFGTQEVQDQSLEYELYLLESSPQQVYDMREVLQVKCPADEILFVKDSEEVEVKE